MDEQRPRYSLAERDRRWELARSFMEQQNVDGLIVFGDQEDRGPSPYYYDTWFTNDRPGATMIFPRTGRPRVFVSRPRVIADHVHTSSGAENEQKDLWLLPEDYRLGGGPADLKIAFDEMGLSRSSVGVLGLEAFIPFFPYGIIPYSLWSQVLSQNPGIVFKSQGLAQAFGRMMMTLSDEEIEVLRHAALIADEMAYAIVDAAQPGTTENHLWRAGMNAASKRGTVAPMLFMYSGPRAINWGPPKWTYSPQSPPRTLSSGDLICCEIFSDYGKRQAQTQLTITVGPVHPEIERAAKVARECYQIGLKALRPGATFAQVCRAIREPVENAGGWSKGPLIHSLNPIVAICDIDVDLTNVGASEAYPRKWKLPIMGADLVLEPGMSFAIEPTCAFGNFAVTVGGTAVVGKDEAIELNPYSSQLLRA